MMKTRFALTGLLATLVATSAMALSEQEHAADLPEGRALVEAYIEAIGGSEAVHVQTEGTMLGEFSIPAAGMTGSLKMASRSPGERVVVIELPGIGEMRSGYSADLAWSIDPFMGPRIIEGDEFQAQVERMEPAALMRDPEYVESLTTLEVTEFDGQSCYRVEVEWKSGRTSHDCYARDSGLLIAMESTESSPMGEVQSLSLLGEYREFENVLIPTVTRIQVMGQEQVLTVTDLSMEAPDDELFELPPAIKTLLEDQ